MNNLNQKYIDEYVDKRQETNNLPYMELVDTNLPLLIVSYYVDCQFTLVNWMNTE